MMIQRRRQQHTSQRIFTASEVAEFEYCPLVWWYEQYEHLAHANSEELFAQLVELEQQNGQQATSLPEYQVIEQLLVRRGAFEEGRQQHLEHAEEVAEIEDERIEVSQSSTKMRSLAIAAGIILVLALLLIAAAFVLMMQ